METDQPTTDGKDKLELERFEWEKQRFKYLLAIGVSLATVLVAAILQFSYSGRSQLREYDYMIREMREDVRGVKDDMQRLDDRMNSLIVEDKSLRLQFDTVLKSVTQLEERISKLESLPENGGN